MMQLSAQIQDWFQSEGIEETETNASVSQQEEQADTKEGEVIADYELDEL